MSGCQLGVFGGCRGFRFPITWLVVFVVCWWRRWWLVGYEGCSWSVSVVAFGGGSWVDVKVVVSR